MATGTELIIGFRGKEKIDEFAASIGCTVNLDSGDILPENIEQRINSQLKYAWQDAITDLGLEVIGEVVRSDHRIVRNPIRDQEMSTFWLGLDYDPYEMGDTHDDAILGISLITRYYPVFLDWDKPHGGSGDVISLSEDVLNKIAIARKHIEKVMPGFVKADIHIKELHY